MATPSKYSCLENPMDRGAWQTTVHGVAKRWTRLKRPDTSRRTVCREAEAGLSLRSAGRWGQLGAPVLTFAQAAPAFFPLWPSPG